jgi:hypothetical protein
VRVRLGSLALAAALAACTAGRTSTTASRWRALPGTALAATAASVQVAALLPPASGWPWLLGGSTRSGEFPDVAIWDSADAASWARAAASGLTLDAPRNLVFSIARRSAVSVAVGETPGQAHGNPRPTIWRSTDARRWTEVPTLREDFGGPRLTDLRAVAAGPSGFAVVGNWKGDDGRPVIAVWLSTDGLQWVRLDRIPELTSRDGEELTAMGIAAGAGGLVIVGEAYDPTPNLSDRVTGFLATSPDGRLWRRIPDGQAGLDNGGQVAIRQVIADGDGFLAFGTRALGRRTEVAAWRPGAGGGWTVTIVAPAGFVQGTSLAIDGRAALGAVVDNGVVRIWASGPGVRWRPVRSPPVGDAQSVLLGAADGRRLLVVQRAGRAELWVA